MKLIPRPTIYRQNRPKGGEDPSEIDQRCITISPSVPEARPEATHFHRPELAFGLIGTYRIAENDTKLGSGKIGHGCLYKWLKSELPSRQLEIIGREALFS